MTEELKNARKEAPRAIVLAVYVGALTGFVVSLPLLSYCTPDRLNDPRQQALIALCFCIGDLEATAATSTGVPVIEIILNSTQSVVGATCLCALITVIVTGASNSLTAEGGRAVYAFARDR
jgi:choline transport protein